MHTNDGRAHLFLGPDFQREVIVYDPTPEDEGYFGQSILLADVDGDGSDEFVVAAPQATVTDGTASFSQAGEVHIFHLDALGTPVHLVEPAVQACARFGFDMLEGDADGDGNDELLVASAGACLSGFPFRHATIDIFHVPDLSLQGTVGPANFSGLSYEFYIHYVGDLTGDAIPDLLTGSPDGVDLGPCAGGGAAWIMSGPDFSSATFELASPACDTLFFGRHAGVGDLDHDGRPDIAIGDSGEQSGRNQHVYLYHAPTFDAISTLGTPDVSILGFGNEVAVGDLDGDGLAEVAVWQPNGPLLSSDRVFVYKKLTLTADADSISLSAGSSVHFSYDGGLLGADKEYVAVLGVSGTQPGSIPQKGLWVPLNADGVTFMGVALLGSPLLQDFQGHLDAAGEAAFALNLPPGKAANLAGKTLSVALVTVDPDGRLASASSPVAISLLP